MEKLEKILCEVFRLKSDELNDELTMDDIQAWDSLTHMDLITSIEEGLNIQLTMDDIMNMKDVKTIKSVVGKSVS
jgi:acyl carrier protein